jgi:ABC-type uncharacterized transport system involved in gliding motility auxiliary subunit
LSWLERMQTPVAIAGIVVLLIAAGSAMVAGEFSVPARLALAVAILLFGTYVAIDPGKALVSVTGRNWVYGSNALLISVAFIGILVLLNVLGSRYHQRWDLTSQRDFSLSESTLKVLNDLPGPVHAKGFFSAGLSDRQRTEDLLKEFEQRANGKFSWEMIDTFQQPSLADLEKINVDGTVLFTMGSQRQTTITSDEAHLTTALIKLVNPTQLKVYYVTGHGERELDRFDDRGYSDLKTQIQQENYFVDTLNLFASQEVPQDAAALIIAAPRNPFRQEELDAINRYLDRKGKLILLVDAIASESNAQEIVKRWDVTFGNGVVVDPLSALPQDPTVLIEQNYGQHAISKDLATTATIMPSATSIEIPQFIKRGVDALALVLTSGNRSWLETDRSSLSFDENADKRGPITLAVAVEEVENPETQEEQIPGFESPFKRVKNRAVIIGSSEIVANGPVKLGANRDFFLNSLNWVTETDQLITTRPRLPERRPLILTPVQANFVSFSGALFLPAILLAIGGVVWWTRR